MMQWGNGYGWMGGGWIFMALFWIFIIVGVVAVIHWLGSDAKRNSETPRKTPFEILQERYARGEIEKDEYEQKRRDLEV